MFIERCAEICLTRLIQSPPEVTSFELVPSSPAIIIYIEYRTFTSTDLTVQKNLLALHCLQKNGRLDPGAPHLEPHGLSLVQSLLTNFVLKLIFTNRT